MVLLGDQAEVEAHFDPFGDCANLDADSCMFAPNVLQARKSFWTRPMELLRDVGHVESPFDPFGDSVSVGAR